MCRHALEPGSVTAAPLVSLKNSLFGILKHLAYLQKAAWQLEMLTWPVIPPKNASLPKLRSLEEDREIELGQEEWQWDAVFVSGTSEMALPG